LKSPATAAFALKFEIRMRKRVELDVHQTGRAHFFELFPGNATVRARNCKGSHKEGRWDAKLLEQRKHVRIYRAITVIRSNDNRSRSDRRADTAHFVDHAPQRQNAVGILLQPLKLRFKYVRSDGP